MTSAQPSEGLLLTDHLRHWAAERPQQRAFTYVDFPAADSPGLHRTLGWRGLDQQARAVAARLAEAAGPGDRAALLLPQGLDYAAAFLGCLYAGVIAVPLFGPQLPGHQGRLAGVLDDCEPACLLTDTATAPDVQVFTAGHGLPALPVIAVDAPAGTPPVPAPVMPRPDPQDIAYLQYTSGSTRSPAGVMISHANVVANAQQALDAFGARTTASTTVGWLPLFHDMGLVLSVAAPVVGGFPSVLMDPVAFLADPLRWLRLLGSYPGTISAAPNFAYDYCTSRAAADDDADAIDELRLDRVKVLINGSEPVRPATVDRFHETFGRAGLAREAHCPSYGLAEATVFVTNDAYTAAPLTVSCDAGALTAGRVTPCHPADPTAVRLSTCGEPAGQELRIADRATGRSLPAGEVGEIQVRGPNIGLGYWKRAGLSAEVFNVRAPGAPDEETGWLRTGDLGALHEGRLIVTGRLKDLIIVDGRNHYPQDVEETVQSAVGILRRDRLAAFCVPRADGSGEDDLVVVAELRRGFEGAADDPAARADTERAARAAVSARHGLRLSRLLLVAPGTVPRTSSGKVSRAASRQRFIEGDFEPTDHR
ncbi:fatty acyl-AMP ligase [Streptomyces sp. NPDC050264]|uniref:fatty acyl-AMP ligase n=1 Tax=Streptomyces sp. NPDC050264 TaxID=3155038 RepID=UPI0034327EAC